MRPNTPLTLTLSAHGRGERGPEPRLAALAIIWLLLALSLGAAMAAAQPIDGSSYACRPLPEVLRDLQAWGLPVIFGSNLVRDDMQVTAAPTGSPRRMLDQLLEPHGLRVQEGAGGRLLVVQAFSGPSTAPPWSAPLSSSLTEPGRGRPDGVLPAWVEAGASRDLTVLEVPRRSFGLARLRRDAAAAVAVHSGSRYLILRLDPSPDAGEWASLAFDLKALIVAARSRAEALEVGIEASPEATEQVLYRGLAPYLDAYVFSRAAKMPAGDPSARLWWRPPPDSRPALHILLSGAAQGAELVLLETRLDPQHRAFLERIRTTPSVDLERQPVLGGIAADRARFLYNLETGSYFLAVYAEPGRRQDLTFSLGSSVEARSLFPEDAGVSLLSFGDRTELELTGGHRFHLVELRPKVVKAETGVLQVDGEAYVDPYEVVVRNQVFQEREAKKVRSLDVMERRHSVSQSRSARRYTWTHRIIERPGRLTEYHHLGVERNGVPFPERKLRVGRDFRAETQVELDPLEIELDRTYRYEYLGEELLDGHPTWKIGFEPFQEGAFLTGTVWIDRKTHAHRKLRFAHAGLSGPLLSREVTRTYGWIPDDGQCFWNWSRSEGLSVIESPTSRVVLAIDAERYGFDYNRGDIEHQVRVAHASDVPIHVATPPDGHRWLVKEEPKRKRRRLLGRLFNRGRNRQPTVALAENRGAMAAGARASFQGPPEGGHTKLAAPVSDVGSSPAGDGSFGGRVLADRNAYTATWDAYLIDRGNCSSTVSCSGFGVDYRRTDLGKNRSELYASIYDVQGYASFTYPRLRGSRWAMTATALQDLSYWENAIRHPGTTGVWAWFEQRRSSISLAFARPVGKIFRLPASGGTSLRARGTFGLIHLGLKRRSGDQTPGFTLPGSILEQVSTFALDFQRRKLYSRASFELRLRGDPDPWGIAGSEPLARSPSRFRLIPGYSTALAKDRSLGSRFIVQKGWSLDHFSDFFSGFASVRAPGFQPQRHDFGLGASVSFSGRVAPRPPVTLRLEGAVLRSERHPHDDADQLGLAVETFLAAWFKTDVFLRLGYGLYSSVPGQDGDLRSRIVISRRF